MQNRATLSSSGITVVASCVAIRFPCILDAKRLNLRAGSTEMDSERQSGSIPSEADISESRTLTAQGEGEQACDDAHQGIELTGARSMLRSLRRC